VRRALVLVALALAGCGPGAGSSSDAPTDVNVVVSRDFGAKELRDVDIDKIPAGETVMRLLARRFTLETKFGGGFVQTLEGLSGGKDADGRTVDWFYYVNGIEAGTGAASRKVAAGDRIWWDRHPWDGAQRVPAVVGSWPEPFLSGTEGKKIPLAIQCAGEERSCEEVQQRLSDDGVDGISRTGLGAGVGQKLLRIVVGPWAKIRLDPAARQLEEGPATSGVYAKPGLDGFELLDADGKVAQTRTDSVGLVAATRFGEQQPTWIVTGTDDIGVAAAAAALRSDVLTNRFAVAIVDGRGEALPVRTEP
jgi:hypothetical protein